jgi:hypothetical protein
MVWLRKILTTGESDPENAHAHAVGLQITECFAVGHPLGNRTSHIVCYGFSYGNQELEEKIVPAFLNVLVSSPKVTFGQKVTLMYETQFRSETCHLLRNKSLVSVPYFVSENFE